MVKRSKTLCNIDISFSHFSVTYLIGVNAIENDYLVKIVDFGMAKRVNAAYVPQSDSNLVGTLPYMV